MSRLRGNGCNSSEVLLHNASVARLGMGTVPAGDTPAEFQTYIDRERRRLSDVIARTGIVLTD